MWMRFKIAMLCCVLLLTTFREPMADKRIESSPPSFC
jgi:hypothetical protein